MKRRIEKLGLKINSVAHIVAYAQIEKERDIKIIASSAVVEKQYKDAVRDLKSEYKKIENVFGKPFQEITPSSRKEAFYDQHKVQPYFNAFIEKELICPNKVKKYGKTKPKQKFLDRYCSSFRVLFALSDKPPNSKLIADIANLFNISDKPQTPETIRTRLNRLTW